MQVCGGGGDCVRVRAGVLLVPGMLAGPQVVEAPRREPFARVVTEIGYENTVVARHRVAFLPRAGLLQAGNGGWIVPDGEAVTALRGIVQELDAACPRRGCAGSHGRAGGGGRRLGTGLPRPRERGLLRRRPGLARTHRPRRCSSLWLLFPLARMRRAPAG